MVEHMNDLDKYTFPDFSADPVANADPALYREAMEMTTWEAPVTVTLTTADPDQAPWVINGDMVRTWVDWNGDFVVAFIQKGGKR